MTRREINKDATCVLCIRGECYGPGKALCIPKNTVINDIHIAKRCAMYVEKKEK